MHATPDATSAEAAWPTSISVVRCPRFGSLKPPHAGRCIASCWITNDMTSTLQRFHDEEIRCTCSRAGGMTSLRAQVLLVTRTRAGRLSLARSKYCSPVSNRRAARNPPRRNAARRDPAILPHRIQKQAASVFRDRVGRGDERCARDVTRQTLYGRCNEITNMARAGSRRDCRDSASQQLTVKRMSDQRNHFDAIVIGAGPAGSASAAVLGEHGHRVIVLERDKISPLPHRRITYPIHVSPVGTARPDPGDEILRRSCANTASSSPRPPKGVAAVLFL